MSIAVLNAKVRILESSRYENRYEGAIGVVENTSGGNTSLGVKIKGRENPRSSTGLFWFADDEVEFIEREENVMLNQNEDFIVAGVKFLEGSNSPIIFLFLSLNTLSVEQINESQIQGRNVWSIKYELDFNSSMAQELFPEKLPSR